jgi:hypothetical protein
MSDNNNEQELDQKLLRLGKELLQKTPIRVVDCDFCNSKGTIGAEREVPEDFYQKFPEERKECSEGEVEYYSLCWQCDMKNQKKMDYQRIASIQRHLKKKTTVGTCVLCHNAEIVGYREKIPEAFYRKFPEEEREDGNEYYHICLDCHEKTERKMADLEQENPCLFKEFQNSELSLEQLMEGMGDQVYRPLRDDEDDDD